MITAILKLFYQYWITEQVKKLMLQEARVLNARKGDIEEESRKSPVGVD